MTVTVNLIDRRIDKKVTGAAFFALKESLEQQGCQVKISGFWEKGTDAVQVVVGEAASPLVERLHRLNGIFLQNRKEGMYIHRCTDGGEPLCAISDGEGQNCAISDGEGQNCAISDGEAALCVVSGSDGAGLAYALYECAERVRSDGIRALQNPECLEDYPQIGERGVDRYIMSHLDEEWWLDERFWREYLPRLQASRFNRFTLITGFDTSYLTLPYPCFVEVAGFEGVRVEGIDEEKRQRNLCMLRKIAELCSEHGMEFGFASWQQAPWTASQKSLISGLPEEPEAFARYCAEGMRSLLQECPSIRIVQLRVNMESGMSTGEETGNTNTDTGFWCRMMDAIAGAGHPVRVEIRAKGATDRLISYAERIGLDVSIATKYWCEHIALPYQIPKLRREELGQPDNMNCGRRYSYGDLLRKPHWYRMIYRLWNYGSANLFLWGSADYAGRFAESITSFAGDGFTVNAPLSLKGGMEDLAAKKPWRARKEYASLTEEEERYWAMYSAFGLMGYHAESGQQSYRRRFRLRFGETEETFYQLYELSGMVLPLITTAHFPVHPSLHYWPELYPGAALFGENNSEPLFGKIDYAHALPSDEELFYSIAEYAQDAVSGTLKPRYTPHHTRAWLRQLAEKIRLLLKEVPEEKTEEMERSMVDFAMLAHLAEFHVRKIGAALHLRFFELTGEEEKLKNAHADMQLALKEWEGLAELGKAHYHGLQFNAGTGTRRCGSWAERLEKEVRPDAERLADLLRRKGLSADGAPSEIRMQQITEWLPKTQQITDRMPKTWTAGKDLPLQLEKPSADAAEAQVHFRHMNQMEGEYLTCTMEEADGIYRAVIPAEYLTAGFDLIVYYTVKDREGNVFLHPGVGHPELALPYYVVKVEDGRF